MCPVEYSEKFGKMIIDCEPSPLFTLHEYVLPELIARAVRVVSINIKKKTSIDINSIDYVIKLIKL